MSTAKSPPQVAPWHLAATVLGVIGALGGYVWSAASASTVMKSDIQELKKEVATQRAQIQVLDRQREQLVLGLNSALDRIDMSAESRAKIAQAVNSRPQFLPDYEPVAETQSSGGIVLRSAKKK